MSTKSRRTHSKAQVPAEEAVRRVTRAYLHKVTPRHRGGDAAVLAEARRAMAWLGERR